MSSCEALLDGERRAAEEFINSTNTHKLLEVIGVCVTCLRVRTQLRNVVAGFERENYKEVVLQSELMLDLIWERLNTGHWKDVAEEWRVGYSVASVLKSWALFKTRDGSTLRDNLKKSLRACDVGLLMGSPIMDNLLARWATVVHGALCRINPPACGLASSLAEPSSKRKCLTSEVNLHSLYSQLPSLVCPNLWDFKRVWFDARAPVVLKETLGHWPAFKKWSVPYIVAVAGHRTVPIEIGSRYTDEAWTQRFCLVADFVNEYFVENATKIAYLAQHQLFEQILSLGQDILVPDYCSACCEGDVDNVDVNAWFGPGGTVSPAHTDPRDNLLCQIFGSKHVILFSPNDSENLYPHEGMLSNTSQVDVESPDLEKFPLFAQARGLHYQLERGEVLFIPKGWWHYLRSIEPSFSVSYWFS